MFQARAKNEGLGERLEEEDNVPELLSSDDEDAGEKEFDINAWNESKNQAKNLRPVDHSKVQTLNPENPKPSFDHSPSNVALATGARNHLKDPERPKIQVPNPLTHNSKSSIRLTTSRLRRFSCASCPRLPT